MGACVSTPFLTSILCLALVFQTVQMDRSRLDELKRCVDALTLMASVLLVTSNQCGGNVFPLPGFVGKLKQVIAALLEGSHHR